MVHDSARSPTNLVPVLSVGSTRISELYWGAVGCSMANVSSRCASKLGGSAATMKISSPPLRGLSWATAGVARANMTTRARQATIDMDVVRNLMKAASRTRKGAGTIARPAGASRQAGQESPMPIATPEIYAEMLDRAKAGAYAYPAINVSSSQTLNAALKGFADAASDGIVQVSTGGAAYLSGAG